MLTKYTSLTYFKRLFCRHKYVLYSLYEKDDPFNEYNYKDYKCSKCGQKQ